MQITFQAAITKISTTQTFIIINCMPCLEVIFESPTAIEARTRVSEVKQTDWLTFS